MGGSNESGCKACEGLRARCAALEGALVELSPEVRRKIGADEATRDPIFLGQVKRVGPPCDSCNRLAEDAEDAADFWESYEPCDECFTYWDTETVFLSRDEGEAWMKAREYRWKAWRVYCVPAEGVLARLCSGVALLPPPAENGGGK